MATANFTVTRRILLIALLLTVLFVFTHSANANYSYTVHVHAIRNPEMGLGSETIPSSQHVVGFSCTGGEEPMCYVAVQADF